MLEAFGSSRSDLVMCLLVCSGIQLYTCTWHMPNQQLASQEWTLGLCSLLGSQTGMFRQEFSAKTCKTKKHHHLLLCLSLKEQHYTSLGVSSVCWLVALFCCGFLGLVVWVFLRKQAKMLLCAHRKLGLCIGNIFP